jgi:hypothetical protein
MRRLRCPYIAVKFGSATITSCPSVSRCCATHSLSVAASSRMRMRGRPQKRVSATWSTRYHLAEEPAASSYLRPRSRDRSERGVASQRAHELRRVLHALANASGAWEGHTGYAPSRVAVSPSYGRNSRSRRSAPPLRPRRGITAVNADRPYHSPWHCPVR